MTLLITVCAAITATVIWYTGKVNDNMRVGTLCLMYWGASLMWLVDAVAGYIEDGADFFIPEAADMLNDGYLGLSVVALGLLIWLVTLLIRDPNGRIKTMLAKNKEKINVTLIFYGLLLDRGSSCFI